MPQDAQQERLRLGFLTAIEVPGRGYVGGLLVTNRHGRPLEFQCTTPVKPNRTQEILYGPTLVPYLLGELIGRTLVDKVSIKPDIVLTEEPQLLELRNHVAPAVACLVDGDPAGTHSDAQSAAAPATAEKGLMLGRQRIRFHSAHKEDQDLIEPKAHLVPRDADLREPFDRVREALKETTTTATTAQRPNTGTQPQSS
jgi:hypothetical protein